MERREDTTQTARALLLVAGALVAFVGMTRESTTIVYVGMAIVAVGFILMIIRRIQDRRHES